MRESDGAGDERGVQGPGLSRRGTAPEFFRNSRIENPGQRKIAAILAKTKSWLWKTTSWALASGIHCFSAWSLFVKNWASIASRSSRIRVPFSWRFPASASNGMTRWQSACTAGRGKDLSRGSNRATKSRFLPTKRILLKRSPLICVLTARTVGDAGSAKIWGALRSAFGNSRWRHWPGRRM